MVQHCLHKLEYQLSLFPTSLAQPQGAESKAKEQKSVMDGCHSISLDCWGR